MSSNMSYIKDSNNETMINDFVKYLCDITNHVEDDEGILNDQLNDLHVQKNSALYNIVHGIIIPHFNLDIKKLIFPFSYNNSQKTAIFNALNNSISLIQGPPGTGKTETILNIIANLIYSNKTVAIVSGNNEAIKNVKEKLQKVNLDFLSAYLGKKSNKEEFYNTDHSFPAIYET